MAKTKIAKLGTRVPLSINIRSKGQRSRSQGHKVQKGNRVAGVSYELYQVPFNVIIQRSGNAQL